MAQTKNVNMTPNDTLPRLHLSQYDVGRELAFNLCDGAVSYTVPTGATVKLMGTKPSGFGFTETCTVSGSTASISTTAGMTDEFGGIPCELVVEKSGVRLGSTNLLLVVEKSPHPEGTTDGSQETVIPTLTLLVERVEAAASSILDMQVEVETLSAGSQATYSYDEDTNTQTWGIPQGEAGAGAAGTLANAYSSSATYAVGDYVLHNSNLYVCTTAITTAEAFTAAHWSQVVLADGVTDLKADLVNIQDGYHLLTGYSLVENEYPNTSGGFTPQNNWLRTDYLEITGGEDVYFNNPSRASSDNVWYDASKNYISRSTVPIGDFESITAPATAKYLIASNSASDFYKAIYIDNPLVENIKSDIDNLEDDLSKANTAIAYSNKGKTYLLNCAYIENELPNTSGGFDSQNNWLRTDYIEVEEGDIIYFNNPTRASSDNVWYYSDKSYRNKFTVSIGDLVEITVPQGAKYMVVSNAKTAFYTTIYTINGYESQIELNKTAIKRRNKVIDFLQKDKRGEKYWEQFGYTSYTISAGAEHEIDMTRAVYSEGSIRAKMPNANIMDVRLTTSTAVNLIGISIVEAVVYIEDVSKITQINLQLLSTNFSRTILASELINGWNRLRYYTFDGDTTVWNTETTVRINIYGDADKEIWIDSVRFLRRPKAVMFFVEDGGYTSFYQIGQPALDTLGVPVTWAVDPAIIGTEHYNMSLEDLQDVMQNGNTEFSFHSYAGERTAIMSESELIADTELSLRWLSKEGLLPKHFWRAAFTQNDAPNYEAIADIIPVLATHNSKVGLDAFPFVDPLNVPRTALHNRSTSDIDEYFDKLQKTHCFICFYTHGIQDDYETNCSIAKWNHFMEKLEDALDDGWLEPTTYNRLMTSEDY